jgi:propionate CoA-transferase
MAKVITPAQAAELIKDNDSVATAAFGLAGWPEEVGLAVEERFVKSGHPKNITHIHAAGIGDWTGRGECHWIHDGLLTKFIGSHAGSSPSVLKAIADNKILAWNLPLGVILHVFKDMARGGIGVYTRTGLGTFIDPRFDGGKLNPLTKENPEQLVEVRSENGEELLFYKPWKLNVGLMRGTTADENGNITCEKEALNLEMLSVAQAVKAQGGIVICQVETLAKAGSLHPKLIKVPGIYVDYIVVAEKPENIMQTQGSRYNRAFTGEVKVPTGGIPPLPLDDKKVMCRRAAMELFDGAKGNFGIGTPTFLASVLAEEKCDDMLVMISESGSIGGVPGAGKDFGCHWNIEASCDQGDHFNFFDGGGLDVGIFGLSEVDPKGNVNTSLLNGKIMGVGGFMNVSSQAHIALFIGNFTAGGFKCRIENGRTVIEQEGKFAKFVEKLPQLSFNGDMAMKRGNKVIFITERCVFERTTEHDTLVLTEIAPGMDLQKDILDHMGFKPVIPAGGPKPMDPAIFQPQWGGLRKILEAKKAH